MRLLHLPLYFILGTLTTQALPASGTAISLFRNTTSLSTHGNPLPPEPAIDAITCLDKPKFFHISPATCTAVFGALVTAPAAQTPKWYHRPKTEFGWSPCHLELRKARGYTSLEITIVELVNAAHTVLTTCEQHQGAGWASLIPEAPWYVLVYGNLRSSSPITLLGTSNSSNDVGAVA